MPQTKKKCCISSCNSQHKVDKSYHTLPSDFTLNAAWKRTLRDHTGNIFQNSGKIQN
jgi:hypothetical protein